MGGGSRGGRGGGSYKRGFGVGVWGGCCEACCVRRRARHSQLRIQTRGVVDLSEIDDEECVKRGNIPLVENPYVISAWAACFSPPFVCYYSSILDIMHSWPIDSYQ